MWSEDYICLQWESHFSNWIKRFLGVQHAVETQNQRENLTYLLVYILDKDLGKKVLKILRQTQIYMEKEILWQSKMYSRNGIISWISPCAVTFILPPIGIHWENHQLVCGPGVVISLHDQVLTDWQNPNGRSCFEIPGLSLINVFLFPLRLLAMHCWHFMLSHFNSQNSWHSSFGDLGSTLNRTAHMGSLMWQGPWGWGSLMAVVETLSKQITGNI